MNTLEITSTQFAKKMNDFLALANSGQEIIVKLKDKGAVQISPVARNAEDVLSKEELALLEQAFSDVEAGRVTKCNNLEEALAHIENL
jgi:hypothetical protein